VLSPLPVSLNGLGEGQTQEFYLKALAAVPAIGVGACSNTAGCGFSGHFAVTQATVSAHARVTGPDVLGVGSVHPLHIEVTHGPPNLSDTYHVTTNFASAMLFSSSPNGPFTASLDVPIQLHADGGELTNGFYVKGTTASYGSNAPQAVANVVACAGTLPCVTPKPVHVVNVNYIYWTTYSAGNEAISSDPMVGGKRIFVGKRTAGDTAASDRRKVVVRAQLSEPIPGVRVRFRFFDVDDPSSNGPPVDPNGSAGDDNRGVGASLSAITEFTDGDGQASVVFSVSRQPGDNFRVAASAEAPVTGTNDFLAGRHGFRDESRQRLRARRDLHRGGCRGDRHSSPHGLATAAHRARHHGGGDRQLRDRNGHRRRAVRRRLHLEAEPQRGNSPLRARPDRAAEPGQLPDRGLVQGDQEQLERSGDRDVGLVADDRMALHTGGRRRLQLQRRDNAGR
jgi:hypothetical protein